jgi:hypothetical protein
LDWIRAHTKNARVAVDGVSLGGAGVVLRTENSGFDAVILEAVFPDIDFNFGDSSLGSK